MPPLELKHESVWWSTLTPVEQAEFSRDDGLAPQPDVLVVGGGIIGLALAQALAAQKQSVQLIEQGTLGGGATAGSAGGIWPADQGPFHPPEFGPLALLSRDLWGRLSLKPDFNLDWRVNGFLTVNPERFQGEASRFAAQAQELGYTVHAIDAEQVARLEPRLAPAPAGGIHCPSDAHLHPLKGAVSFARAARRGKARLAIQTKLLEIERVAGRVVSVRTSRGECRPRHLVMCTGHEAVLPAGVLRPVWGQLISTDPLPPLMKCTIGGPFLTLQLKTGEVVTGGTQAEGRNEAPDAELSAKLAEGARRLLPDVADLRFTRAWCGVRSATRDGLPIIDRAAGVENEWLAVGHHRNGLLLAPGTADLLARWMLTDEQPEELQGFGLQRLLG
jgi:glycine oxidase